jgi:hypothetical protein
MAKVAFLMYLVTYSQTHMLIAEAIVKEWATGNAETAKRNDVIAHLEQVGPMMQIVCFQLKIKASFSTN